jgi:hypothetical protein
MPRWLEEIEQGTPPLDADVLEKLTSGEPAWLEPFISLYFDRFIKGENNVFGSKVKLIISNEGSGGKSHFLYYLQNEALKRKYQAAYLRTGDFRLNYFQDFYAAIVRNLDFEKILEGLRNYIIIKLGFSPDEIPADQVFMPWAESKGENLDILKRVIRNEFSNAFLHNPRIDRNFAYALLPLIVNDLERGKDWNEPERRQILMDWIAADSGLLLSQIKREQIYVKINRQNARRMLCSLAEVIRIAGFSGLVVCIDELDDIMSAKLGGRGRKYTKSGREDIYESIRELIDDQESLQGILFMFASRREIISDEQNGIKSYPALWMRIQEEVAPKKSFNPYVDLIDLDRLWMIYGKDKIVSEISDKIFDVVRENTGQDLHRPDHDTLQSAIEISPFNMRHVVRILASFMRRQIQS